YLSVSPVSFLFYLLLLNPLFYMRFCYYLLLLLFATSNFLLSYVDKNIINLFLKNGYHIYLCYVYLILLMVFFLIFYKFHVQYISFFIILFKFHIYFFII